jgi:hypothetical protein
MKKYYMLLRYLAKETFNRSTFKLLFVALVLSGIVGSSVYISNIGILVILQAYNIAIPPNVVHFLTMGVGSKCVYGTIKGMVKEG